MSASAKKKLRKEQTTAQMTEKQLMAQKEAKKLKAYTTVFVIAIIAVFVAGLIFAGINIYTNSGLVEKHTVAATVNGEEINSVHLSYYYTDTINATYSQWSQNYGESLEMFLGFMGLDATKPLNEQQYDENITWADHFLDSALEQAKSEYLLCAAAEADGFTLTDAEKQALADSLTQLEIFSGAYGYPDVDTYLRSVYGPGADKDSYYAYSEKSALASAYYNAHNDSLSFDDAAIRAYEADKFNQFSSYSFATYHLSYTNYLTGGTQAEDGSTVYTHEEEDAARAAAMADAELLSAATTVEELDHAIAQLPVNEGSLNAKSTVFNNSLYSTISTMYRDWLTEDGRKEGDTKVVAYESDETHDDGHTHTVTNDFYVVLFLNSEDNITKMANIRHILVKFEGGTTDENDITTYSDAEKAAAKTEAEAILEELAADGTVTEDEFAEKANAVTDDTGSSTTGGLYEHITPEEGVYVESFKDWAMDPARTAGETGIIETEYGYHVMYYVGDDAMTYRDYMIAEQMRTESMTEWYEGILATGTATLGNTSRIKKDITLNF